MPKREEHNRNRTGRENVRRLPRVRTAHDAGSVALPRLLQACGGRARADLPRGAATRRIQIKREAKKLSGSRVPQAPRPKAVSGDSMALWASAIASLIAAVFIAIQAFETKRAAETTRDSVSAINNQASILDRQAIAAEQAAKAATESADAAKKSADALIAVERALVMVDFVSHSETRLLQSRGTQGDSTCIFVTCICANQGRSMAQIIEKGYVFKIVTTLPPEPDFHNIDVFHRGCEYVKPNDVSQDNALSPICAGHRSSDTMMVLYGRVKYRDQFGERETRFGYQITGMNSLERLPATSYPEYNKHT